MKYDRDLGKNKRFSINSINIKGVNSTLDFILWNNIRPKEPKNEKFMSFQTGIRLEAFRLESNYFLFYTLIYTYI